MASCGREMADDGRTIGHVSLRPYIRGRNHRTRASVFRKASEWPLYRIEKDPRLARKQGAYSIVAAGGLIVKRGHDLNRVIGVLENRFEIVS